VRPDWINGERRILLERSAATVHFHRGGGEAWNPPLIFRSIAFNLTRFRTRATKLRRIFFFFFFQFASRQISRARSIRPVNFHRNFVDHSISTTPARKNSTYLKYSHQMSPTIHDDFADARAPLKIHLLERKIKKD
jgi:hypothetical protein